MEKERGKTYKFVLEKKERIPEICIHKYCLAYNVTVPHQKSLLCDYLKKNSYGTVIIVHLLFVVVVIVPPLL